MPTMFLDSPSDVSEMGAFTEDEGGASRGEGLEASQVHPMLEAAMAVTFGR
jgi:hypothetical protein